MFVEALQALEKLQTIISHVPEVVYQIANIHELMGNTKQAMKWYQVLASKTNTDSSLLARLGALCAREEDEDQALHYFTESYRYMPVNLETISWLGIYYVKNDLYERACHFFERASQIQPKEVKNQNQMPYFLVEMEVDGRQLSSKNGKLLKGSQSLRRS